MRGGQATLIVVRIGRGLTLAGKNCMRLTRLSGIAFALAFVCSAALADEQIIPAQMAPVASGGERIDPAVVVTPPVWRWRITKTEWSASDERAYSDFIAAIGASDCRKVDQCLQGPANIYRSSDPKGAYYFSDCADLPYMLRAYFAWKNGLPFSYASGVAAVGASRDLRYSRYGNYVFARQDVVTPVEGAFPNARSVLNAISNVISSAMFRYAPGMDRGEATDFYPVRIAPGSIRPGTVIYDPNGHVAVVYDVDDEGRIRFMDAHPDNSLTRGNYGRRFVRASPPMGAGFKNWRPLKLVGAMQGADGTWYGGRIESTPDKDLPDWSDEQFYGTATPKPTSWQSSVFVYKGQVMDYYDYVRHASAGHDIVYDPVKETRSMVAGLCEDLQYRLQAVDMAIKAGLDKQSQPLRLPPNIYGTEGDWETYSTPSRDARLKVSFQELHDQVASFLTRHAQKAPDIAYAGSDLKGDLERAYVAESRACNIAYQASNGEIRNLPFEEVRARLFDMSFDPYHCVERRWGATSAAELATCQEDATKRAWYEAEARLRNQTERTYDARMDFDLADLRSKAPGSGQDAPPPIDVLALFNEGVINEVATTP